MAALDAAREELETVTSELRVQQALGSKLTPGTMYHNEPGDYVPVYREKNKGPYVVKKVCNKKVYLDVKGVERHFNIELIIT